MEKRCIVIKYFFFYDVGKDMRGKERKKVIEIK